MTATSINSAIPFGYKFVEKEDFYPLALANNQIGAESAAGLRKDEILNMYKGRMLDLISDQKKVFIMLDPSFYHNIHDTMNFLVKAIHEAPDAKIYINASIVREHHALEHSHIQYVLQTLGERKIDYELVDFRAYDGMWVSNYYVMTLNPDVGNSAALIYDFVQRDVINPEVKPYRNVYLSRRNQGIRNNENPNVTSNGISDNRIDDHDKVENFFRSLGFEIIIPEDTFKDFKEQINFFHGVKTLVSVTSSGLSNAIFMQPGQTVVEIKTPLALQVNRSFLTNPGIEMDFQAPQMLVEELHHFYEVISFKKNHLHISVPNPEKNMLDVITKIYEDKKILKLLSDRIEM